MVNDAHPDGVFNVQSLKRIFELTQYARTLKWPDPDDPQKQAGVIEVDIIAPSTVDNIEQGGLGEVRFSWLMPKPPTTREEALAVRNRAQKIPFLDGTLVSEDGKAISLYLPLSRKDLSYRVRGKLLEKIAGWPETDDRFYITGLPVAEDTFGVEMFIQMAISAPLAMVVIFLVMWWFFRNLLLILSPMIVAMVCVISTMALLVIAGKTIHIMSSMIPVFIMPIAVLDAVHILSEFFDRYQETRDRRRTLVKVMEELFTPMLFTSLTTAVGFASLALTPIPPVQVFGIFVAIGVLLAWLGTICFIPAFVMFIPEERLANFGHLAGQKGEEAALMSRWLGRIGTAMFRNAKLVLAATVLTVIVAGYGISQININDNPVKWFSRSHPIRVADRVLNAHFGGTYMAYLELEPAKSDESVAEYLSGFIGRLDAYRQAALNNGIGAAPKVFEELRTESEKIANTVKAKNELLTALAPFVEKKLGTAPEDQLEAWDEAQIFLDSERQRDEIFKQPDALRYIAGLQEHLKTTGIVGKSNSLADIVKTVHRELLGGDEIQFRIPDTSNAVAQTLITFQNSHRPQDIWHFVTPDYRRTNLWVQLTSGDNQDMTRVVKAVNDYVAANPPPYGLNHRWFGLTYINVIWQEKMVSGMLRAFLGSFLVVLVMMMILFRSAMWGLLSMIPLTVTVGLIYGLIGLIGKDYDMPVAVLSALSIGLAVDYAIHFLARSRSAYEHTGSWQAALGAVFGEPARAITRNAIVLGLGFLPLLAGTLVPYKTVGVFIAAILLTAGLATLLILPALITLMEKWLFRQTA
ncbi:MAG: MMPL family transporter [Phycisphaerae bacterium]